MPSDPLDLRASAAIARALEALNEVAFVLERDVGLDPDSDCWVLSVRCCSACLHEVYISETSGDEREVVRKRLYDEQTALLALPPLARPN